MVAMDTTTAEQRRVTRRGWLGLASAGAATLTAASAACSPRQPEAESRVKRTQPITLESWTRLSWVPGLMDKYNAGPGKVDLVTVAQTVITGSEYRNKLLAAAASDTLPDFTTVELNWTAGFNVQRIFADISKEYSRLKVKDQFPPAMVRYGSHEGKVYQVPFWVDATGLYWNKNLFRAAGLDPEKPPKTWDDMTAMAVKLTRAPDVWGVTIPYRGSATWQFMPWVYANGGKLLSDDGKKVLVNSEEAAGAFQLWHDLAQKRQVTPDGFRTRTTFNATQLFLQGKLAMYHAGYGVMNQQPKDAPDLVYGTTVIPIGPKGKKTGCSPGGDTMGIFPKTKYREEAWRLLEWLIGSEAQVEHIVAQRLGLPILTSQVDNRYFKEEPRFAPFREAAQAATPTWTTKFEEFREVMLPEYMAAVQGEKEPRAALRDMAAAMERVLAAN